MGQAAEYAADKTGEYPNDILQFPKRAGCEKYLKARDYQGKRVNPPYRPSN